MNEFPFLLSPMTIRGHVYRNRILGAPFHGPKILEDGSLDPEILEMFASKAEGGYAEVALGEAHVDFLYANRSPYAIPIDWADLSEKNLRPWRAWGVRIKAGGGGGTVEINHAGHSREPGKLLGKNTSIGPMAFTTESGMQVLAMDEAMMEQVAESFATCAYFMKQAGFDGVVPHYGHGWLMTQFLSPLTNRRRDDYGGRLENRARFPIMTLRRIRARCGEDFLICPRVSGEETSPGGMRVEEVAEFCKMLEGLVDLLHISVGDYRDPVLSREFSSIYHPHACNAHLAAYIKARVHIPVSTVGGINSPELSEQLIREGKTDFVALGRQGLADPDFANKTRQGKQDEINRCLRCYRCFGGPLEDVLARNGGKDPDTRCSINPWAERWVQIRKRPQPKAARKVLVIGGGFAGMEAAITAAERGHAVTLAEASGSLGGLLRFTERDGHKTDIRNFKDSLITRLGRRDVEVLLHTKATPEWLQGRDFDALILACGSLPMKPPIPGLERAKHVLDAYETPDTVGRRVVILGGGLAGCEAGIFFAERGHDVTLLEMRNEIAPDAYAMHHVALKAAIRAAGLKVLLCTRCLGVTETGVRAQGPAGGVELPADSVLFALGMRARDVESLEAAAAGRPAFRVGDCVAPRKIVEAIEEGFDAAWAII